MLKRAGAATLGTDVIGHRELPRQNSSSRREK
jgi:hypothetical protein